MPVRAALLPKQQTDQIFQAIDNASFDRNEFELSNEGGMARLTHRPSGSLLAIYRDLTCRFVGHYAVNNGSERPFDLSWVSVIKLLGLWLAEVKRDRDAVGL